MTSKRPTEDESSRRASKRQRQSTNKHSSQATDLTYGQRAAFGDLRDPTVPNDDDLEWEDETDALAYLMSVRQEAHGIPNLLVASKPIGPSNDDSVDRSIYTNGKGDFRGFYQDGAYTALPDDYYEDEGEDEDEEYDEDYDETEEAVGDDAYHVDYDGESSDDASLGRPRNSNIDEIHEAYYGSLINQYLNLRRIMHSSPPDSLVASLPDDNPTEVENFAHSPNAFRQWTIRVTNTDPLPAQIASMHKDGVIRLLRIILSGKFFRKGQELRERTSRWLWALLARLPDKGELYYQEIGWIRELGKRAVLFMVSLAEAEILHREYDVRGTRGSDESDGVDLEVDEDLDEVLSQLTSIDDTAPVREDDPTADGHVQQDGAVTGDQQNHDQADDGAAKQRSTPAPAKAELAPQLPEGAADDDDDAAATSPSDVEMPDDSDMDEGEVSAVSQPKTESTPADDVEMAKSQLLAQLNSLGGTEDNNNGGEAEGPEEVLEGDPPEQPAESPIDDDPDDEAEAETEDEDEDEEAARAKANVRTTLNMILTVAGEFYGQRDLLEFRDPFGRVLEEGNLR